MKVTVKLHATMKKYLSPDANGTAVLEVAAGASVANLIAQLKIPAKHAGMTVG